MELTEVSVTAIDELTKASGTGNTGCTYRRCLGRYRTEHIFEIFLLFSWFRWSFKKHTRIVCGCLLVLMTFLLCRYISLIFLRPLNCIRHGGMVAVVHQVRDIGRYYTALHKLRKQK